MVYLHVGVTPTIKPRNLDLLIECHDPLVRSADQHYWFPLRSLDVLFAFEADMSLSVISNFHILLSASQASLVKDSGYRVCRLESWLLGVPEVHLLRNIH
jgi:hypothetical protein